MAAALSGPGSGPQETIRRSVWWRQVIAHTGGGLLGGLALGAVLAGVVALLGLSPWSRAGGAVVLTGVAVWYSMPRFIPPGGVGTRWQVPRGRRLARWGRGRIMLFWGALLGAGVITVVPHAIVLLLPALGIATGSPLMAVVAGVVFGAARALLAVATSTVTRDPYAALELVEPLRHRLARASVLLAPLFGLVVVSMVVVTWP